MNATGPTLLEAFKAIRAAAVCDVCGKSLVVANANAIVGLPGHRPERITRENHCTCEGGPAHHLRGVE